MIQELSDGAQFYESLLRMGYASFVLGGCYAVILNLFIPIQSPFAGSRLTTALTLMMGISFLIFGSHVDDYLTELSAHRDRTNRAFRHALYHITDSPLALKSALMEIPYTSL